MSDERKIRVLHLLLSLETGGMERFVYEHCLAIDRDSFEVSVCCIDRLGGFYDELEKRGIRVDLLQKSQKHFDYFFPFRLSSYLRRNRIDILHIHTGAFFLGSVAGFLARTPGIIYTEHGRHLVEPRVLYVMDLISAFFVDKIITVSAVLERYLIEKIRLPAGKIITVINGVNTEVFKARGKPYSLLEEFRIGSDCRIVGAVGRLAQIKDQATLIRAFRIVREKIADAKLIIVGEGPCEKELKDLSRELNLAEHILFAGNRDDIPALLNLFDVFVLSSLMEGTSISLLEAMASGVVPVATGVGGNVDIVRDGVNGYVTPPQDPERMAAKIIDVLEDPVGRERFQLNARQYVENHFSFKNNLAEYMAIYQSLLKVGPA